jgi:hypothetical protein
MSEFPSSSFSSSADSKVELGAKASDSRGRRDWDDVDSGKEGGKEGEGTARTEPEVLVAPPERPDPEARRRYEAFCEDRLMHAWRREFRKAASKERPGWKPESKRAYQDEK